MSELRRNPVTGQTVIFATDREGRPFDFATGNEKGTVRPYDAGCPFCPGNETGLPDILYEMAAETGAPWQTRIVPNKFPAIIPTRGEEVREKEGSVHGHHEVIIETPFHDRHPAAMTREEMAAVVDTYLVRYRQLAGEPETAFIVPFRNHGQTAGASRHHPHSQIVSLDRDPPGLRRRRLLAERAYGETGQCLVCRMIEDEGESGLRTVAENDYFFAFVPFAAEGPFETWIAPKRHQGDFGALDPEAARSFAGLLRRCLIRIDNVLDDPGYNYAVLSETGREAETPYAHWFMRILPRLSMPAGFEMASAIIINVSDPDNDAASLREG